MIRKLIKLLMYVLLVLLILATAFLGFTIYKTEKERNKIVKKLEVAEKRTTKHILEKENGDPKEEEVVRLVLYLSEDEKEEEISSAYLCFFDRKRKRVDFYFLPGDTVFECSKELYGELRVDIAGIPQIARLSHFHQYLKSQKGLKAGMLFLNDAIGTNLKHFILLPKAVKDEVFTKETNGSGALLTSFATFLAEGKGIKKFVNKRFKRTYTDLSEKEMTNLLKGLKGIQKEAYHFFSLPIQTKNYGSIVQKEEALRLMYSNEKK